jgi:hypothetical protein
MGAPLGNKNGRKAKDWEQALRRVLSLYESPELRVNKGEALAKIAEVCVLQAISGDKDARAEIANRLDGKVPQALIGGDDDDPPITVKEIVIRAVDAAAD